MLMSIPTCIVITQMLVLSEGAPKLGHILSDPLSLESSALYKIRHLSHRRAEEQNTDKPGDGYDYDEMKCRLVNNRILCGYNKNNGEVKRSDEVVDLGNGCRMRHDRIECGYVNGPFDGKARPKHLKKLKFNKHKPTRTFSRENILRNLTTTMEPKASNQAEKRTEYTQQTPENSKTTKSKGIGRAVTLTIASKDSKPVDATIAKGKTVMKNSKNTGNITENHPTVTTTKSFKTKQNLRDDIVVLSSTIKFTFNVSSSITTTSKIVTSTKPPVTRNNLNNDAKVSVQNLKQVTSTKVTENPSKPHVTENHNQKPTPLCIEKEDRIICYDTAKFVLIKKKDLLGK